MTHYTKGNGGRRTVATFSATVAHGLTMYCGADLLKLLAGTTGLEPAASCVTGMRSNQLNYVPSVLGARGFPHGWQECCEHRCKRESESRALIHGGRYPARTDDLLLVRQTL